VCETYLYSLLRTMLILLVSGLFFSGIENHVFLPMITTFCLPAGLQGWNSVSHSFKLRASTGTAWESPELNPTETLPQDLKGAVHKECQQTSKSWSNTVKRQAKNSFTMMCESDNLIENFKLCLWGVLSFSHSVPEFCLSFFWIKKVICHWMFFIRSGFLLILGAR